MVTDFLMLVLYFSSFTCAVARDRALVCLPKEIKAETIVSTPAASGSKRGTLKRMTVKEVLTSLKARCKRGKLVDGKGREIRFVSLIGCWGNPPEDYEEQLKRQAGELDRLRKSYTVIEIPCDQGRDIRQIN